MMRWLTSFIENNKEDWDQMQKKKTAKEEEERKRQPLINKKEEDELGTKDAREQNWPGT